jgi:DNA-binding NarL/FixJ family response regulator
VIRVFVDAGSELVRAGLEAMVASSGGLALVGRDADAEVALAEPDSDESPVVRLPTVWITDRPIGAWLVGALRSGVKAVLPHASTAAEIAAAVQAAAAGLVVLPAEAVESLLPAVRAASTEPQAALTPREIDVLRLMAEGVGNKELAWRLGISDHTVKSHIGSIFNKLDVSTRTEAVTAGIRRGLILL